LPHYDWGKILREIRGQNRREAVFLAKNKRIIKQNSFLMDDETIKKTLIDSGLSLVKMYDLKLPRNIYAQDVSIDIRDAATAIGVDEYSLPIVKLILAKKLNGDLYK
jgi:hypothetical protein